MCKRKNLKIFRVKHDLTQEEMSTYDFTNLFSLYIEGAAVEVT